MKTNNKPDNMSQQLDHSTSQINNIATSLSIVSDEETMQELLDITKQELIKLNLLLDNL